MNIDKKDWINSILETMSNTDFVKAGDIPNIPLYMDQVTTFMDANLESTKRHEDDKILTKTMINNYTKNKLLPPSEKKKYSSEHILMLIFIYYLKSFLSITDIQDILKPISDKYFDRKGQYSLQEVYERIVAAEEAQNQSNKEDIRAKYEKSLEIFADAQEEDKDYMQMFTFICLLSYDVYTKKQLIESIVDQFSAEKKQ